MDTQLRDSITSDLIELIEEDMRIREVNIRAYHSLISQINNPMSGWEWKQVDGKIVHPLTETWIAPKRYVDYEYNIILKGKSIEK